MKGFIELLALLIHWIGFALFVVGVLLAFLGLITLIDRAFSLAVDQLLFAALFIGFGLFLWVLKWLTTGNKSILPWKSS
jgi:hypothetical protein